ncbi:hypothetical protein SSS_02050 [Sarcoptes scabiei]|uniref:Uncharacterized protein n=1 Tax=Sarcoptes scabiei TaxID=52283 RepID=A0A834R8D9_SARSC|nr:hypothetical protein SSS_02050 [Sarcoptes scabiei]
MKKNMSNQNENNIVFGDDNLEQIQWNHRNRSRWKFSILLQNFKSINLIVITTIVIVIIVNNQIDSIEAVGGRGVAISSKGTRGSIGAKPVDANEDSGTLTVILVVILPVAQMFVVLVLIITIRIVFRCLSEHYNRSKYFRLFCLCCCCFWIVRFYRFCCERKQQNHHHRRKQSSTKRDCSKFSKIKLKSCEKRIVPIENNIEKSNLSIGDGKNDHHHHYLHQQQQQQKNLMRKSSNNKTNKTIDDGDEDHNGNVNYNNRKRARNNQDCLIGVGCVGGVKKCDDSMIAMRMINPHRFDCYPLNLKQTSNSLLLTKKMRPNFDRNRNPILKSRSSAPTIELHNLHQHCSPQSFSSSFRPRSSLITSIDCDHNDQNDQSRFVSLNESQSLTNLFSYEVLRASSNTVNQLPSKRIRDHQCQYLREQLKSVPYEIRDIDPNDNHRISSATKSFEQTKKFDKNLDKNLKIFSRLGPSDNFDRNCSISIDDCDCDDSDPNLTAQSNQKRSVLKMNDCDDVGVGVGVDDCTSVMMENFDDSFESRNHHHSELNPLGDCYVTNRSVALSLPFRFESNQTMNQKKSTSNCSFSSNVSVSFQKLKHLDEPIDLQHSDSRSSTDRNESNLRLDRKPNSYVSC